MSRRVVITGLGVVSPFGYGAGTLWDALIDGRSAIKRISGFDPSGFACQFAAAADDVSAREYVPKSYRKALKVMARDTELAVVAAKLAVEDAGLVTKGTLGDEASGGAAVTYPPERFGCQIGAGLIAAEVPELGAAMSTSAFEGGKFDYAKWGAPGGGMENLTPLWLLKYLPNMLACHVTIIHDAQGPSNTITCGEASGGLSVGESVRVIERGAADLCFSGGAESKLNHMGMIRQEFAGRIGKITESEGWRAVRPYDPASSGAGIGEGGGIVIVEALEKAQARGAKAYAEVLGIGAGQSRARGAELYEPSGEGLRCAIENALEDAGVSAGEIDAIVPQAASSKAADEAEAAALRAVFGSRLAEVPLVTLTPNIGNTHAGEGGIQASVAALCLKHGMLPARLHAGTPAKDLQAGACGARDARLRRILTCSASLGGQNAALVLGAISNGS